MKKKLGPLGIAIMYLGVIMGAGFSTGRESWQFFGVFGDDGYWGTLLTSIIFILMALMLTYIALSKQTTDIGKLISPIENPVFINIIGCILAGIYYTLIISMSAAGGSLLEQQLGLSRYIGGFLVVVLVFLTVLGNFGLMSRIFDRIMPVVYAVSIFTILSAIFNLDISQAQTVTEFSPSMMSPNWWVSGIIFAAYNGIGMLSVAGTCALNAKTRKTAFLGTAIGTILLSLLMFLLLIVLLKDPQFSSASTFPMLGYATKINQALSICYTFTLFGSIYMTASSTYFGFSTKIPEIPAKKMILVCAAILGFFLGLVGFQNLVAYLYPAQGYFGIIMMCMIVINFCKECKKSRNKSNHG